MKKLFLHITCFFIGCFSQNEQLAQYYYDKRWFWKNKIGWKCWIPWTQVFFKNNWLFSAIKAQFESAEKPFNNDLLNTEIYLVEWV
jgi:hypothetical protein